MQGKLLILAKVPTIPIGLCINIFDKFVTVLNILILSHLSFLPTKLKTSNAEIPTSHLFASFESLIQNYDVKINKQFFCYLINKS